MFRSIRQHKLVAGVALTAIIATTAVVAFAGTSSRSPLKTQAEVDWVTDVADPRGLAGVAHNIFLGVVVAEVGTERLGRIPETQFRARITDVVKGTLAGEVVVNQLAGKRPGGSAYSIEGDKLLLPGREYLFATMTHPNGQWQTVVDVYGTVEVESVAHRDQLLQVFRNAAAHPKTPDQYWRPAQPSGG